MRKIVAVMILVSMIASVAAAHNGHIHHVLGTVKSVGAEKMVLTKTDGREMTVLLTKSTRFEKVKKAAKRSDVRVGSRISVDLANDSRTAVAIRIGAAKK